MTNEYRVQLVITTINFNDNFGGDNRCDRYKTRKIRYMQDPGFNWNKYLFQESVAGLYFVREFENAESVTMWNEMLVIQTDHPTTDIPAIFIKIIYRAAKVCREHPHPQYAEEHCWYPRFVDPYSKTIGNGKAIDYFPEIFYYFNLVWIKSMPTISECQPGYWLTCKDTDSCEYNFPLSDTVWNTVENSNANYVPKNVADNWPVGQCYPCHTGRSIDHFVYPGSIACGSQVNPANVKCRQQIYDFGVFHRVYCPGGLSPPLVCPVGSRANTDMDGCVCESGKYYDSNLQICEDCPVAHYCVDNIKTICPIDTYQSTTGQSSCLPCTVTDGSAVSACSNGYLPAKCSASNGLQFQIQPTCIPCKQCRNSIIDSELGYSNVVSRRSSSVSYYECYED